MSGLRRIRARSLLTALLWLALAIGIARIILTLTFAWTDVTS